jgi:hypothetical protein
MIMQECFNTNLQTSMLRRSKMEPELRGIVEQYVDFALSDAQMLGYGRYVNTLKPYVKSIEDAIFGLVVGMIVASCIDQIIFYIEENQHQTN